MGLSQSDIHAIAGFVRKVTKAPSVEAVISESFETLKTVANVNQVRIVYSAAPAAWKEWRASRTSVEVRSYEEWPAPEKRVLTVLFDPENGHAGFISVDKSSEKVRSTLEVLAPEVWSALLLQSALTRVQKAAISETELVREIFRARDEERRHIARELHDDLGQSMASLKLSLKWAEDLVRPKPGMSEAVKELSIARQDAGIMLDKIRDLSHTLYPRILDTLGLVAAVKELAHQASRHSGLKVECGHRGRPRALGKDADVALYRCCQEALNNALRHSGASKLSIFICFAPREVRVTVEDDGKGFDPRALYDSNSRLMSSGFWTIRQRMADLGAAFRVSTAEGHGTVVEMIVPYSSRKAHDRGKNKTAHRG
ncbi:MAG: sensor histidine kinase [Acidobacteria bacterium]|nr:sensor histidine kinase [Acidobacteriota bacterium]